MFTYNSINKFKYEIMHILSEIVRFNLFYITYQGYNNKCGYDGMDMVYLIDHEC